MERLGTRHYSKNGALGKLRDISITRTVPLTVWEDGYRWYASWSQEDDPFWSQELCIVFGRCRVHAITEYGAVRKAKRKLRRHARLERRAQRSQKIAFSTKRITNIDIDVTDI